MVKPEWGTKRVCQACNAGFYDLHRDPITCPKCGVGYDADTEKKSRRARSPGTEKEGEAALLAKEVKVKNDADLPLVDDDADGLVVDDDEDPDLLEDASELGEDEHDMAEVIENISEEREA